MASKKLPKGTTEFEMFGDFYNMVQEFYTVEESDEYWDCLIAAVHEFEHKYGVRSFARELAAALVNFQERMMKEGR